VSIQHIYDISKKDIDNFRSGKYIAHKDEGEDVITLNHAYFMQILEERERYKQALKKRKKR